MIVVQREANAIDLRLTQDELRMLHGALNETCNGVEILDFEFQTRLGYERKEMLILLDQIDDAARHSRQQNPV